MDITRIGKTALPAVVVLVAGLFGINFVYNTYLTDGAASVITLEPAAGEEGVMVSIEDGATSVTTQQGDTLVTTITETVTEAVDACATADEAAAEAIGTDAEATAAQAAKDCRDAKAVAEEANVKIEEATQEAVDAAVEGIEDSLQEESVE